MGNQADLTTTTLPERITLLGVTYLTDRDETPAHTGQIVGTCTWEFGDASDVLGSLSEADVSRALNRLEADGIVEEALDEDASPVGKGRPRYSLSVDPETVLDHYAADDQLAELVAYIRDNND